MLIALWVMRAGKCAVSRPLAVSLKSLPPLHLLLPPGMKSPLPLFLDGYKMTYPAALLRMILYVLMMGLSFGAMGDDYPATAKWIAGNKSNTESSSADGACNIWGTMLASGITYCGIGGTLPDTAYCKACSGTTTVSSGNLKRSLSCPYGGTLHGEICRNAPACSAGQARDPVTGECKSPCEAGTSSSASQFRGWATSINYVSNADHPSSLCDGNCLGSVSGAPSSCYVSYPAGSSGPVFPAQLWCDFPITLTGATCTEGDKSQATPQPSEYPKDPNAPCGEGYNQVGSTCIQGGTNPDPGTGTGTDPGTGTGTDPGTGTGTDPGTGTGTDPGTGTGTDPGTGTGTEFPTDYNREATQQEIKQKLEDINGSLKGDGSSFEQPYDTKPDEEKRNGLVDQLTNWLTGYSSNDPSNSDKSSFSAAWADFISPPQNAGCTPAQGTIHGRTAIFDYCELASKMRDIFGYILWVCFAWYLFDIATRSKESQ